MADWIWPGDNHAVPSRQLASSQTKRPRPRTMCQAVNVFISAVDLCTDCWTAEELMVLVLQCSFMSGPPVDELQT